MHVRETEVGPPFLARNATKKSVHMQEQREDHGRQAGGAGTPMFGDVTRGGGYPRIV